MTDCDGKKLKKGDQVWVYDPGGGRLRLAVVRKINGKLASISWVAPIPADAYTGAWVGQNQLVRCAGQD